LIAFGVVGGVWSGEAPSSALSQDDSKRTTPAESPPGINEPSSDAKSLVLGGFVPKSVALRNQAVFVSTKFCWRHQKFVELDKNLLTAPKVLLTPSNNLLSSTKSLLTPSKRLLAPSNSLLTPSKDLLSSTQSLLAPSKSLLTSSKVLLTPSRSLLTPSKSLLSSTQVLLPPTKILMTSTKVLLTPTPVVLPSTGNFFHLTPNSCGCNRIRALTRLRNPASVTSAALMRLTFSTSSSRPAARR
jgi:hypothetical protein